MSDTRKLWVTVLYASWAIAFGYSFYAFWTTVPEGDGFTRGANRVGAYLGWQGIAGLMALAVWGVGRGWPKGAPARAITSVPLVLALLQVAGIVAVIIWARFAG